MKLDELKTMWLSNDVKLEKSLKLNEKSIELIQAQKLASKLAPLYRQRVVESICHSVAIVILVGFLAMNMSEFPYALSALFLLVFYIITLSHSFRQMNLIKRMDFNNDLVTIQSSLVELQTHILNYAKLAVLFIPAFLAYPTIITKIIKDFDIKALADFDIMAKSNGNWWAVQFVAFVILIPVGIWFYREVSYKNLHKKWVRKFIEGSSGSRVTKALHFLKELQESKQSIN